MKTRKTPIRAALGAAMLALATGAYAKVPAPENEPVQPLEAPQVKNAEHVRLGKMLWFEPRLSKSGFISCNSCHNLSRGGSDNLATSIGHNWAEGPINSPRC